MSNIKRVTPLTASYHRKKKNHTWKTFGKIQTTTFCLVTKYELNDDDSAKRVNRNWIFLSPTAPTDITFFFTKLLEGDIYLYIPYKVKKIFFLNIS